jgi:hypothetical protein
MLQAFVSPRQVCVGTWVDLEEPGVAPAELRVDSPCGSSEIRDLPHGEPVHFLVSQAEKHALAEDIHEISITNSQTLSVAPVEASGFA